MWTWFHKLGSPKYFYSFSSRILPWLISLFFILFSYGLISGLAIAPADYQQGDGFRIIYLHVPAAFMSMGVYVSMAIAVIISWVWKMKLADIVARVSAPIGASFTFLALITGAIWGKPMWGTWWVWDARLTSELILLFLYLGIMALHSSIRDKSMASRASGLLTLVGVVNIPIIHYSVQWWNTLHQGATLSKFAKPSMSPEMLYPLLAMIFAFGLYYGIVLLLKIRCEILHKESQTQWVRKLITESK